MKRLTLLAALALLAGSAVALQRVSTMYLSSESDGPAPVSATQSAHEGMAAFEPGATLSVDLSADARGLQGLSEMDRADQVRDWLLFAAAAALVSDASEYAKIFFDLPTSRQGQLRSTGALEFGEARSRYLGKGRVLALVPKRGVDDSALRRGDLGEIADQQRKNLGGAFEHLIVVEYELDTEGAIVRLTRVEDVGYARLFATEFGYYEKLVTGEKELADFIGAIDELTYAKRQAEGLLLGGRASGSGTRGRIGLEEIATIWKAEKRIAEANAAFDALVASRKRAFLSKWNSKTYSTPLERQRLEMAADAEERQLQEELQHEYQKRNIVKGSGFSLDPKVDFEQLSRRYEEMQPLLVSLAEEDESAFNGIGIDEVADALGENDIVPLRRLIQTLQDSGNVLLALLLDRAEFANSYQSARYDGDLKGTEVGMTLFYTDLIAKLWTIDYADSSPARTALSNFLDDPHVSISKAYDPESEELSNARLWFGPSALGYQTVEGDNSLLFASNATRIYSAGSSPTNPGAEVQTSAFLAASIDWWNDHYDHVARYEPQYERLDQVMKWSALIAWLNANGSSDVVAYLQNVPVSRSHVFLAWAKANKNLRFSDWDSVGFHAAGYKGATTESLPLLSGPVTSGGVSLASKENALRRGVSSSFDDVMRRSNLDYARADARTLTTLEQTTFTLQGGNAQRFSVLAEVKDGVKMRSSATQYSPAAIERTTNSDPAALGISTRMHDASFGELNIAATRSGLSVRWRSGELERAQEIARRASTSRTVSDALVDDPLIETAVVMNDTYAVKLHGSDRWIKLAPEEVPSVDIDRAWQLRAAAGEAEAQRVMQASVVTDTEFAATLESRAHFVVDGGSSGARLLRASNDGAPANVVPLRQSGVEAWVDPATDALHVRGPTAGDTLEAARRLTPDDLTAIRGGSAPAQSSADAVLISEAFLRRDNEALARLITENPTAARKMLDELLSREIARSERIRDVYGLDEALHHLDALKRVFGNEPAILLRQAEVQLARGNPLESVASLDSRTSTAFGDRTKLLDEVSERLKAAPPKVEEIHRYAQFLDLEGRVPGAAGQSVRPRVKDGKFDFDVEVERVGGEPVALPHGENYVLYRQNDVALNTIDWAAPVQEAMNRVVETGLGTVIKLPNKPIAQFRPARIIVKDTGVEFERVGATQTDAARVIRVGYQICNDDSAEPGCGGESNSDVYVVVAKSASAP